MATMPARYRPSSVKASLRYPWSTHLLSMGVVDTVPEKSGTGTGARSIALFDAVRAYPIVSPLAQRPPSSSAWVQGVSATVDTSSSAGWPDRRRCA